MLKLTTPDKSRFRWALIQLLRLIQWVVVPVLLIWSLNRFAVDTDDISSWVERTFSGKRAQDASVQEWLLGPDGLVESVTVGSWDKILRWSTPVFQLAEGFCSLLCIQAAGQMTRWLVNRGGRSESWMVRVGLLTASEHADIVGRLVCSSFQQPSFQAPSTFSGG